jgi:hypothetical protein
VRAGIIQSCYIPWRGYFDFINEVDLFIFHDDLQYTKGDWRNRNKIKTPNGLIWLTVPVKYKKTSQLICETEIDYSHKWQAEQISRFKNSYIKSPFFKGALELWEKSLQYADQTISQLNIRLINNICSFLGIGTKLVMSSDYAVTGSKTERLIRLLKKVGATVYLSGPSAKGYLDENLFQEHGICLEYKTYDYPSYPQLWGDFIGTVTVLDLIANCGPNSRDFLKSLKPNIVSV